MAVKVRADLILRQIAKRHVGKTRAIDDVFLTEVKNGKTWDNREPLRMDALAIRKSWVNPCVTGYEVKVSRNDFLRDEKWPGYLNYCNEFYFACPIDLIQPEELPTEVGLIYYNPEKDRIRTVRKAVYRQVEIPVDMLWYLIMSRVQSDNRHPFFSNEREYLQAWLEDKEDRKNLGMAVSIKAIKKIRDLEGQIKSLERDLRQATRDQEILKKLAQLAIDNGFHGWGYDLSLVEFFQSALNCKIPLGVEEQISTIQRALEKLKAAIKLERKVG